jgi:hypothetical protein
VPPHPGVWQDLSWPEEYPLAQNEMSFLLPHFLADGRGRLDTYFIRVYNPVWTNPDGLSWMEVLTDEQKVGCFVALTPTWSESAYFADYVLPMGHASERHDTHSYEQYDGQWLGFRQPLLRAARERRGEKITDTRQVNPGEVWEENEFWIELSWRIDPDGSLGLRRYYESLERPGTRLTVDEYYGWMFANSVPGLPERAAAEGLSPLEWMRRYGAFEITRGQGPVHEQEVPDAELTDSAVTPAGARLRQRAARRAEHRADGRARPGRAGPPAGRCDRRRRGGPRAPPAPGGCSGPAGLASAGGDGGPRLEPRFGFPAAPSGHVAEAVTADQAVAPLDRIAALEGQALDGERGYPGPQAEQFSLLAGGERRRKPLPAGVGSHAAAGAQLAVERRMGEVDLEQRARQGGGQPGAVEEDRLLIGQPEPFQVDERLIGGPAEGFRGLRVGALLQVPDNAALREAVLLNGPEQAVQRAERLLDHPRPDEGSLAAAAVDDSLGLEPTGGLPDGLAADAVLAGQLGVGGEARAEFPALDPAAQVSENLRPQGQGTVLVDHRAVSPSAGSRCGAARLVLVQLLRRPRAGRARPRTHIVRPYLVHSRCRAQRREVSSAIMSAAGLVCFASATLCPAHSDSASMSPVVPSTGSADE